MSGARPGHEIDLLQMAEDDGFEAFVRGMREQDNPIHPHQRQRHWAWQRGWLEARKYIDAMKGTPA